MKRHRETTDSDTARKRQYQGDLDRHQHSIELRDDKGATRPGIGANFTWHTDPRRLAFGLSRYKFVSKMLSGRQNVLEVGCGDAFCTRIVLQEVGGICAIDYDPDLVADANERMEERWSFDCRVHDILSGPVQGPFDAAYALDMFEHIPPTSEHEFMRNIADSLHEQGVLIIGIPSAQSQVYASELSKEGHVNCKEQGQLAEFMSQYFHNVFSFSMNDEVVHTGFSAMAHYLFALCVGKKPVR